MPHFLVYHNAEQRGHSFREFDDNADTSGPFAISTKKSVNSMVGNVIWLISGEGTPREYCLEYWFVVDGVTEGDEGEDDQGLDNRCSGTQGVRMPGGLRLNEQTWFPDLRRAHSNFSLGMQRIQSEFVEHLIALTQNAGYPVPPADG